MVTMQMKGLLILLQESNKALIFGSPVAGGIKSGQGGGARGACAEKRRGWR